ncbi:MAG: hypothetical protein G01um101425_616 [Candidatus Peregrinibacteria bacterium Gr01-1014_25]|nr:MAG: hypothetical protein G01um101425_616 [Candidatus Peregrinibacteria bacterium Gr01-1014_25]
MRTAAVFFDEPNADDYPFSIPLYRTVYRQLGESVAARGGRLAVVRDAATYRGNGTFAHGWVFDGTWFADHPGPLHTDLLWNKGRTFQAPDANCLNDPALDAICTDKWRSYELLHDVMFPTALVTRAEELVGAMARLTTERVVLKPLGSYGGQGVLVGAPADVAAQNTVYPCIVQEFIDTSGGIPGIVDGMHDLRIISINGDVGLSYIRTPPPGEYTANVSRGGKEIEVPPDHVPPEALAIFRHVDQVFSRFPRRLYTVDMGRDRSGRWAAFEVNAKPGFSPKETGPSYPPFYDRLAELLLS